MTNILHFTTIEECFFVLYYNEMVEQTYSRSSQVKMSRYEILLMQKKMKKSFAQLPKIQKKAKNTQIKEQKSAESQLDSFLNSSL